LEELIIECYHEIGEQKQLSFKAPVLTHYVGFRHFKAYFTYVFGLDYKFLGRKAFAIFLTHFLDASRT
jgi:hypothetical protein